MRDISFHDSSIQSLRQSGGSIVLELESVYVDGALHKAILRLMNVTRIIGSGKELDQLHMESHDGEILSFEDHDGWVELLVEWNDFKKHESKTVLYRIYCSKADISVVEETGTA